jgi:hypothetical protein
MKRKSLLQCFQLICLLFALLCVFVRGSRAEVPAVGSQLPQFTLPAPETEKVRSYLGLKSMEPFTLSAITAKVVVIEFLSAT